MKKIRLRVGNGKKFQKAVVGAQAPAHPTPHLTFKV